MESRDHRRAWRWLCPWAMLGLAVWMVWRPTPPVAGVREVNGRVEGDQAAVGTKVGGQIVRLAVREGDQLEAGALLAELASDQVQAQLDQTQHALHTAQEHITAAAARVVSTQRQIDAARTDVTLAERESQAQVGAAQAALGAAQARRRQAEADLEKAAKDYERSQGLFAKKIIAAQQLDAAQAAQGALGVGLLALGLWQFRRRVG